MNADRKSLYPDPLLLLLVLALAGLGLVMLMSASSFWAEQKFGDSLYFFKPQLRNMLIGLVIMLIMSAIPYQWWTRDKVAYPVLLGTVAALALVFVPGLGVEVNNAFRWIRLPGFSFQPSEAAKLAIVIYLGYSLTRKGEKTGSFFYGFLPHLLVLSLTVGLILLEPDLGTAVCVVVIAFTMMFVAGSKVSHILALVVLAIPVLYYQIVNYSYRLKRIAAFLDPWEFPDSAGYHIIHSFYAFANGGLWGQGPGGSQQKLFFLPESHTDFIFSVVAEELGFAGVAVIALLFLLLVIRGLVIARSAHEFSGVYLALGCTMIVGMPAFFNMGVVTALLPTKGLPLPFFSYGGTNLFVSFAAMGILLNIAAQSRRAKPPQPKKFQGAAVRRTEAESS